MEDIKIKNLLKSTDGTIAFIEFIENDKFKILSYANFVARFGIESIEDLK